ncbi:MAG: hypothetical protein LBF66_02590 [Holosporales bacterium]|nr:hypothetical protein [Holosporales bacterium]
MTCKYGPTCSAFRKDCLAIRHSHQALYTRKRRLIWGAAP